LRWFKRGIERGSDGFTVGLEEGWKSFKKGSRGEGYIVGLKDFLEGVGICL
jgi:hypothetical protein